MTPARRRAGGAVLFLLGMAGAAACARDAAIAEAPGQCATAAFEAERELAEAGSMSEATDPCWWLSSGGLMDLGGGHAKTIQGALPAQSEWRVLYARTNAADTDDGLHPQNLLRLVSKGRWKDYRQEVQVRIVRMNPSASPERNEWSGVFLFLRYQDSQTLYYAGVRMDGTAVIKKKFHGTYTTLAQEPVFGQPGEYSRDADHMLLPTGRWLGLAANARTEGGKAVRITLATREPSRRGDWRTVVEAVDGGQDSPPILDSGHGGLRTDFMDVEFAAYRVIADP